MYKAISTATIALSYQVYATVEPVGIRIMLTAMMLLTAWLTNEAGKAAKKGRY